MSVRGASVLTDDPPQPPARPSRRRSVVVLPPVQALSVEGYIISDYEGFDRVGRWERCSPACPEAAYLLNLYPDEQTAREAIPDRARALMERIHPRDPDAMAELVRIPFRIVRVEAAGVVGRDYRSVGCGLPGWHDQLHNGTGQEPAWSEIRRQRDSDAIEGLLLPGRTRIGDLFLYVDAARDRIAELEHVDVVEWSGPIGDR